MQHIYRRTPMPKSELLCNFIEITLRLGCSPVNLLHIFRTLFSKNTSGRLLPLFDVFCLILPYDAIHLLSVLLAVLVFSLASNFLIHLFSSLFLSIIFLLFFWFFFFFLSFFDCSCLRLYYINYHTHIVISFLVFFNIFLLVPFPFFLRITLIFIYSHSIQACVSL